MEKQIPLLSGTTGQFTIRRFLSFCLFKINSNTGSLVTKSSNPSVNMLDSYFLALFELSKSIAHQRESANACISAIMQMAS
jgi:hypothetical protein